MKLGYIILYVPDVIKTIEFYERAFGLTRKFVHETNYAELETGMTSLAFVSEARLQEVHGEGQETSLNRPSAKPAGAEIAFVTDDVEMAYNKAVAAGALPFHKPQPKPWGQLVGYVRDLNGFLVEICSPM